jgi:geranylgeranyl diphosphate synthase type II
LNGKENGEPLAGSQWQAVQCSFVTNNLAFTEKLLPRIEAALDRYSQLGPGCPERLKEAMRYSLLAPGKRLRPMLALLAAEACGGEIEPALPAACAVEMIHAYSLIHDDLPAMDDDDLRRGRPTCHKAFDEATAILAGDALLALAFETVAKHIQPPAIAAACTIALAEAAGACQLVGGQMDDMYPLAQVDSMGDNSSRLDHLTSIHRRKTGAMIQISLRLGGMVAGAERPQLESLDRYGENIGLAFQVVDDLLDIRSSQEIMGKRTGKDSDRGKLTFPSLFGLDRSTQYAAQLVNEACESLAVFGQRAAGLEALARYVQERNS